jgi:type II secretory pathway component GspD/PulD (secretin)
MKSITAGLAVALAAFAVGAPPKSQITKVTSTSVAGGIEIAVIGENVSKPKAFFLSDQTTYIVQFNAPLIPSSSGNIRVGESGLSYYKYVRFQPGVSRVLLKVSKGVVPTVTQQDNGWKIRVGLGATKGAVTTDSEEMERAIQQMDAQLASFDAKTQTKGDSGNTPLKVGAIVGSQGSAGFIESAYASTLTAETTVPAPIGSPYKDTNITVSSNQADILVIFEAFAKQANVNIIAAPDVSPKDKPLLLSLTLKDVDLDFAMTSVAALADLRFTRIANTFIVSKTADFGSRVGSIMRSMNSSYETRVVNISSGEATQIKDATLQALPQDGPDGYYEIVDPTKKASSLVTGVVSSGPGTAGTGEAAGGAAPPTTAAPADERAKYVMLIGEPRRLDVIEAYVRSLDKRISASFSLSGAANYGSVVVPIVSGQTAKVKEMLTSLLENNPRRNDYQIEETAVKELAQGQESMKLLMIGGPKEELEILRKWADNLDAQLCLMGGIDRVTDPEALKQVYEVVDLKYIEPVHAQFDLTSRVKGLYVTILPDPVTPGLTGEDKDSKQDTGDNGTANGGAAGGATAGNTQELKREIGHEQMRLVLRGTKSQIAEAKAYLQSVDLPARQVSIELRVMELTKVQALQIGLDWSVLTGGRLTSFRMNQGLGNNISQGGSFTGHYQDNATTGIDVLGKLDQLETANNIIAKPNALVTDGRSSHLFIGDTVRYIKLINASQNGTTVEIGEVEVGVKVDITARIGADGNIALDLFQNFSILQSFTPVPGGGAIPQTSDRSTEMFVNMRDGETLALGGLILEQDRKSVSGIPILKDLPIIGYLFKRTDNRKEKSEIVFFLTAKVIDNDMNSKSNASKADGEASKSTAKASGN